MHHQRPVRLPARTRRRGTTRLALLAVAAAALTPAVPADAAPARVVGATTPKAQAAASGDLKVGSRGTRVRMLQRALGLRADGVFGRSTRAALRRWQRSHGLKADGVARAATRRALGLTTTGATRKQTTSAPLDASGGSAPQSADSSAPVTLPISDAGGGEDPAATGDAGATGTAAKAIAAAEDVLGTPYASAGTTTAGFDCSGLTQYAFRKAGVTLPRSSFEQFGEGTSVTKSAIQPGDLVFFSTAGSGASHVGIALGGGKVISATTGGVAEHAIDDSYWGSNYVGARRVL